MYRHCLCSHGLYTDMAYIVMACIVIPYKGMAHIVVAHIAIASYSCGLYGYGLGRMFEAREGRKRRIVVRNEEGGASWYIRFRPRLVGIAGHCLAVAKGALEVWPCGQRRCVGFGEWPPREARG